uniref:hypothetical protein n=1 Tax=Paractinoplanes polyasparticus TaxID=2856853 RepID=UPI001C842093|nr:hypothetical protein [Actinoplanes polyasparticus]
MLIERLAAAGFHTYADYTGHRIHRQGTRDTVRLIRSDGSAVQVAGIGPDKAIALDVWLSSIRQDRPGRA